MIVAHRKDAKKSKHCLWANQSLIACLSAEVMSPTCIKNVNFPIQAYNLLKSPKKNIVIIG